MSWWKAAVIGGAGSSTVHQSQPDISPPGASSSYSDMAVSYEQWVPAAEPTQAYYPSVDMGPGYGGAYNLPITSEYGAQQRPVFGETISQTYVRRVLHADSFCALLASHDVPLFLQECQRADPSMSSFWSLMGPSHSPQVSFGSMDMAKLEEARMLLRGMDYSRATGQDEDGDTWVLLGADERKFRYLNHPHKDCEHSKLEFSV